MRAGDVIVAVGDEQITSYWDLVQAVQAHKPGSEVELTVIRERSEETLSAKLDESKGRAQYFGPGAFRQWKKFWPHGLPGPEMFEDLEEDLGDAAEDVRRELRRLKERLEDLERRLERLPRQRR